MANVAEVTIAVVGNNAERVLVLNHRRSFSCSRGFEFESMSSDKHSDKDYLQLTKGCWGFGCPAHHTDTSDLWGGPAALVIHGQRNWRPPLRLVQEWSVEFPDLTWYMTYRIEGLWDEGAYKIKSGQIKLIEHRVGWFKTMQTKPYGAPVHHYVVAFENDPVSLLKIKQLSDVGTLFRTETTHGSPWGGDVWAFRCDPQELLKEGLQFAYEPVAYTLDEEMYIWSMRNRPRDPEQNSVELCTCPIKLLEGECEWLMAREEPDGDGPASDLPEDPPCRVPRIRHRLGVLTTRSDLTALLTRPNMTAARRAEIEAAMRHPRWTREWPQWSEKPGSVSKPVVDAESAGVWGD
jgi:hypothetical protein